MCTHLCFHVNECSNDYITGGLHAVVSSARGIARDIGALLGGVLGVCVRYLGVSVAVAPRVSFFDFCIAVASVEAGLLLR